MRNSYLLLLYFCLPVLTGCELFGHDATPPLTKEEVINYVETSWSAQNNSIRGRIGGGMYGNSYEEAITSGTIFAEDKQAFIEALRQADSGDVVYIPGHAVIDLSGVRGLTVTNGVTIASSRGHNGSLGAMLKTGRLDANPLFQISNQNMVAIKGLRLRGPDGERGPDAYYRPNSIAIQINQSRNITVENCEIYNWSHAGIAVMNGSDSVHILNNYIHDCERTGLGYAIVVSASYADIGANVFNQNRRSISATGLPKTSYDAYLNVNLPTDGYSHTFDVHKCGDSEACPETYYYTSGTLFSIRLNTFYNKSVPGVLLRGVPDSISVVKNWFAHSDPLYAIQLATKKKTLVADNVFSP